MSKQLNIQVTYAKAKQQKIISLSVTAGCSAIQAVQQSNIINAFPEIDLSKPNLGVFGNIISTDYLVEEGDRIEIYRHLIIDPKESRRQRAELAKRNRRK